jgi:hypothetical protein
MHPRKLLIRFVLWFTGFSILFFILPPKSVYETYGRVFRAVTGTLFKSVGNDGFTRFCSARNPESGCVPQDAMARVAKLRGATDEIDSLIVLGARKAPGHYGFIRTSSHIVGYYTTALLVVLFLSTPIPWRRRLMLGALGFLLVNLFIAVRVYVFLLAGFSSLRGGTGSEYAQYTFSKFVYDRLEELKHVLTLQVTVSFVAAVFLWVAVLAVAGETKGMWRAITGSGDEPGALSQKA